MASSSRSPIVPIRIQMLKREEHLAIFKFSASMNADPRKWQKSQVTIQREDNRSIHESHRYVQDYGEGSEFGRAQRLVARQKKRGYAVQEYRSEGQPWILTVPSNLKSTNETNNMRRLKGMKEGSTSDNADYWVMTKIGEQMIATPVSEWYNFVPMPIHALNDEEAESAFAKRDKMLNLFALKSSVKPEEGEMDDEKGEQVAIKPNKSFLIKAGGSDDEGGKETKDDDDDEETEEQSKDKKKAAKPKKNKKDEIDENDEIDYGKEDEGEPDEAKEFDYWSSDNESEPEPEKIKKTIDEKQNQAQNDVDSPIDVADLFKDDEDVDDEDMDENDSDGGNKRKDDDDSDSSEIDDEEVRKELHDGESSNQGQNKKAKKRPAGANGGEQSSSKKKKVIEDDLSKLNEVLIRNILMNKEHTVASLIKQLMEMFPNTDRHTLTTRLKPILSQLQNTFSTRTEIIGDKKLILISIRHNQALR